MQFFERLIAAGEQSRLHKLRVRHVASKDSFVLLPAQLTSELHAGQDLPLVFLLREIVASGVRQEEAVAWHVAWAGFASSADAIDIPAALANCLGIPDGITVSLQPLPQVKAASRVDLEPTSEDDWELVEIHADHIEEQLLNQVGVVQSGQSFPFWVGGHTVLHLRVSKAEPASVVKLGVGLELAVAPRPRQRKESIAAPRPASAVTNSDPRDALWLRMQAECPAETLKLRDERLQSDSQASTSLPEHSWHTVQSTTIGITRQIAAERNYVEGQLVALASTLHGRRITSRVELRDSQFALQAFVPSCVLASLQLWHHNNGVIFPVDELGNPPAKLILHPIAGSCEKAVKHIRDKTVKGLQILVTAWLSAQQSSKPTGSPEVSGRMDVDTRDAGIPLQDGTIIALQHQTPSEQSDWAYFHVEQHGSGLGPLQPKAPFLLTPEQVSSGDVVFETGGEVQFPSWGEILAHGPAADQSKRSPSGDWMLQKLKPCLQWVLPLLHHPSRKLWWKLQAPAPGGLLVCGPEGSGKSALVALMGQILANHPVCETHVIHIDCRGIETETLSSAKEELEKQICKAVECVPSLLIFENLHVLCPAQSESPEAGTQSIGTTALVSWLCDVLDSFRAHTPPLPVVSCATSLNASDVNECLRAPGRLDHTVALQPPSSSERQNMLKAIVEARSVKCNTQALQVMASKAEGCDAADLQAVVERALHAAVKRSIRSGQTLAQGKAVDLWQEDLDAAWTGFTPAASWGLAQGNPSAAVSGWEDVGGLDQAKAALQEALELPAKFAKLLAKAPLRLRTGVLLFGPPGCGKTHIVAAAVAAAKARFLSIKGPELLNKYIGASEAAVRDVFRQASAAAPCVLFFDEFDAIAPQRGHDSTGVTDRVVNQLLTELDGVEGLKGVVVLAATSRPDLLDAALLRPGRLDRLVYCGMPDGNDRLAILTALCQKLSLADNVNLPLLATKTTGYSGADLAALLADAQLAAVHDMLAKEIDPNVKLQVQGPSIAARNIDAALRDAMPSLPARDLATMEQRFDKFQSSRKAGVGNKDMKGKGMRSTLA